MIKSVKHRFKIVGQAIAVACSNPQLEMTDTLVLAQWRKKNRCFIITRSINHVVGLLIGQIALLKNGYKGIKTNNKQFVGWVADGLESSLKKNVENTPPYAHLHVRKVKMREVRKRK